MSKIKIIFQKTKSPRREERRNLIISSLAVTAVILIISLLTLFGADREFSENENRYLAQKPSASLSSVADGRFMEDSEKYLSDQFFSRDIMVQARTSIDIFLGKKEENGVYIGKEGFLFEKPSAYDEERVSKTAGVINSICEKHPKIKSYIAAAPNSSEILKAFLPLNAPDENQSEQIKKLNSKLRGITKIDLFSPLNAQKEKEELYYRTDHHWTAKAAKLAFDTIAGSMKLDLSKTKYRTMAVTNSFQGTMASSSGLFSAKDTIFITVPEPEIKCVASYPDEKKKRPSIFDSSKLKTNSKYEVFLGGNFSEIIIDTTAKSDRTLLLIKDSYANCVVPMLTPYFKRIAVIDPRYYVGNINETISKENVTDILWLYNTNTLLSDTSIFDKLA